MRQIVKENDAFRRIYYRIQMLRARAQSDETKIIDYLTASGPQTFVEFGFHPIQFNCISLAKKPTWQGLLVDGNSRQISDAIAILPSRLKIVRKFLTLENIDFIRRAFQKIGVLSIDVDGNDYWFLRELLETRPAVICIEYNSTFGREPVTVPYDPTFDRHEKHPSGWYHGASLAALCKLCGTYGYGLAAVSAAGVNAFFTPDGNLDPSASWRPNAFRETYSGVAHDAQWQAIKELPFVLV